MIRTMTIQASLLHRLNALSHIKKCSQINENNDLDM